MFPSEIVDVILTIFPSESFRPRLSSPNSTRNLESEDSYKKNTFEVELTVVTSFANVYADVLVFTADSCITT